RTNATTCSSLARMSCGSTRSVPPASSTLLVSQPMTSAVALEVSGDQRRAREVPLDVVVEQAVDHCHVSRRERIVSTTNQVFVGMCHAVLLARGVSKAYRTPLIGVSGAPPGRPVGASTITRVTTRPGGP